jgi:hypothetical protein
MLDQVKYDRQRLEVMTTSRPWNVIMDAPKSARKGLILITTICFAI